MRSPFRGASSRVAGESNRLSQISRNDPNPEEEPRRNQKDKNKISVSIGENVKIRSLFSTRTDRRTDLKTHSHTHAHVADRACNLFANFFIGRAGEK